MSLSSSAQRNWSNSKAFAGMLKALLRLKRGCSLMQSESDLTRSLRNVGLRASLTHSSSRSRMVYIWGGALGLVGYVVNTTKRCVQIVQDEDMFKAGAYIKIGRNMGTVHVCPYVGEVTGELRGKWLDAHWTAAIVQSHMNI
jgi:hypothetical protein